MFYDGDAGLKLDLELRDEGGKFQHQGITKGAKNLSELEKMGYKLTHTKKEKGNINFNEGLRNALIRIANEYKDDLKEETPVDERRYADNVVMRDNIAVEKNGRDSISVGYRNIPYATRRNYEHTEHYNSKGKNLQFIERSRDENLSKYQDILDEEIEDEVTDILKDMLQDVFSSSGQGMAHRYS